MKFINEEEKGKKEIMKIRNEEKKRKLSENYK